MGVVGLLGNRVPESLKIFLLALAIIDDLGAIIIIAIFYTADLSLQALGLASIGIVILIAMNRLKVQSLAAYVLVGIYVWACVLESGVHATLAGSIVGLCVPLRSPPGQREARSTRSPSVASTPCIPGSRSGSCRPSPSPMPASHWPACPGRRSRRR